MSIKSRCAISSWRSACGTGGVDRSDTTAPGAALDYPNLRAGGRGETRTVQVPRTQLDLACGKFVWDFFALGQIGFAAIRILNRVVRFTALKPWFFLLSICSIPACRYRWSVPSSAWS